MVNRSVAAIEDRRKGKVAPTMGMIGLLELQKALARLSEPYVAPVEHDYWVY